MDGIKFNTDDFDKKTTKLLKQSFPENLERALGVAMLSLMNDCINEVPTVPLKEGWLRGSVSVFVNNKFSGNKDNGKTDYMNKDHNGAIPKDSFVGVIGFNAPYAARLHEGIGFKFTEPSSGAKYLESKLLANRERYLRIVAECLEEDRKKYYD